MLAPRTLAELQWLQHMDSGLIGKMVAFDTVAGREIPANASSARTARDLEVELEPARRGWVAHGASWAISPMWPVERRGGSVSTTSRCRGKRTVCSSRQVTAGDKV
jgi:hypothetical protein